jgi:hypothetical protein
VAEKKSIGRLKFWLFIDRYRIGDRILIWIEPSVDLLRCHWAQVVEASQIRSRRIRIPSDPLVGCALGSSRHGSSSTGEARGHLNASDEPRSRG